MTVYLCTCGTSAAKNLPKPPPFNAAWVENQGGIKLAAQQIFKSFEQYPMSDEDALTCYLSAEIHSLARMKVGTADRVVLFSSETGDGQACAEALKLYLEREIPGIDCVLRVVDGLQVRDATRFRTQGVVNFVKMALQEIEGHGAAQCVFNPTGGFKSLVPYTVLLGMIKGVEARYIFEQSSELIALPSLPVEFARERLEPLQSLIERIERDSFIGQGDWERAVSYEDRQAYASLFERVGDDVTLSPVGFLVLEELRQPRALVPFLSRRAIDDLIKVRAIEGCKPLAFLSRVAKDRSQLESAKHEAFGSGLFWLKPGNHTRDRYLVSVEGWRLLVWRIVDHDEYDDMLERHRKADQGKRIMDDRRSVYEPFFRMDIHETE
jgi:putative CRISPR-associated protein (TIGR02619 family)